MSLPAKSKFTMSLTTFFFRSNHDTTDPTPPQTGKSSSHDDAASKAPSAVAKEKISDFSRVCSCGEDDEVFSVKCIGCRAMMAYTVRAIVDTCSEKLEKLSYDISEFERRTVITDAIGGTDNAVSPGDLKICLQQQMTAFEVACRQFRIDVGNRVGRAGFRWLLGEEPESERMETGVVFQMAHNHRLGFLVLGTALMDMTGVMNELVRFCDVSNESDIEVCVATVTPNQIKSQLEFENSVLLEDDTVVVDVKMLEAKVEETIRNLRIITKHTLTYFGIRHNHFDPTNGWHILSACNYVQKHRPREPEFKVNYFPEP